MVKPGATAEPWVDYRKILDGMSQAQRREAVGAGNYKLLKEGVVTWEDVVTSTRVRSLREVVAREKLTVKDLKAVGIRESVAKSAWTSVHTTAHEAAAAHRKTLVENLSKAGLTPEQIKQGFSRGIASRVKLIEIPPPKGPAKAVAPLPVAPLIDLFGLDAAKVKAALQPKPVAPYAPSKAKVEYSGWGEEGRKQSADAVKRVLGDAAPERIASLVGAPDDAKVTVGVAKGSGMVLYDVEHPDIDSLQGEFILIGDKVTHHVHAMYVNRDARGKGFGGQIHGKMVQFGAEHGVDKLKLTAMKGEEENGYITWPIFGYDGAIPKEMLPTLPEPLQGRKTIQDLMGDEEGQRWWKTNGDSVNLTFPLGKDSPNVQRWEAYRKRKAGE